MTRNEGIVILKQEGYTEQVAADTIDLLLSEDGSLSLEDKIKDFLNAPQIDIEGVRNYRINEEGHLVDD